MTISGITNIVRPEKMDDLIGLEKIRNKIMMVLEGAKKRQMAVPSFILGGPSGCGKTTVSGIIGNIVGGTVHKCTGTDIKKVDDVYDLVTRVKDNDVVYIEEAHTIGGTGKAGKHIQAVIYEWIEEFRITSGQQGIVNAPAVCFIFATTDPGKLLEPLRNRCTRIDVTLYKLDQLKAILLRAAAKLGHDFSIDEDALEMLAKSSRGLPRVAIMGRLDKILSFMAVHEAPFNVETVDKFFEVMDIDEYGLETNDKIYCHTIHAVMQKQNGRPVAAKTIQQMTGLADNLVEQVIEPYLLQIGFIEITGRGRIITPIGCAKLNLPPIQTTSEEKAKYAHLSLEEDLPKMLEEQASRDLGTQGLMALFGLKYTVPAEREKFRQALEAAGYVSKRRSGIVKKSEEIQGVEETQSELNLSLP